MSPCMDGGCGLSEDASILLVTGGSSSVSKPSSDRCCWGWTPTLIVVDWSAITGTNDCLVTFYVVCDTHFRIRPGRITGPLCGVVLHGVQFLTVRQRKPRLDTIPHVRNSIGSVRANLPLMNTLFSTILSYDFQSVQLMNIARGTPTSSQTNPLNTIQLSRCCLSHAPCRCADARQLRVWCCYITRPMSSACSHRVIVLPQIVAPLCYWHIMIV